MRRLCHLVVTLVGCSAPVPSTSTTPDATPEEVDSGPSSTENVELKVDIPEAQLALLGLDDGNVDKTQDIWFFDTAALALFDQGLILRARKVHNGGDDTTVKARPMEASQTPAGWLAKPGAKCEIDRTLDHEISSCSLKADAAKDLIDAVTAGGDISTLYTTDQLLFLGSVAGPVDLGTLSRLGPIASTEWKLAPQTLPPVSVERWILRDGTRIVEVSTRTTNGAADAIAQALVDWLAAQGVTPTPLQDSKTRLALLASRP